MVWNEEGGVLTQKLNFAIFAVALLALTGFAGVAIADDSSADSYASADVTFSASEVKTSGTVTATLNFNEGDAGFSKVEYSATLLDSTGKNTSATITSPTGSSATVPFTKDLTVTAPSKAGTYTLKVVYTETIGTETKEYTVNKDLKVSEPVTLTVKITNPETSSLAITDGVFYFVLDNKRIEESKTTKSIAIGDTATFTYELLGSTLSKGKHTYSLVAADNAYNVSGLGTEHTFYYDQGNMNAYTYLMVLLFIIVTIIAVWIYRKPVKNYGKPKARR
ncbi:hypothetical protein AR505_0062 [methanogenic archaeon ISO4-H5]|nr:hypothetical protein AR505_0062 [methanogenic archaeon ISO4-H5]